MKKVLFLQHKGSTFGGVWSVNKTLAEEFTKNGYDVTILSIRESFEKKYVPKNVRTITINENDLWEVPAKKEIFCELKKLKLSQALNKYSSVRKREEDIKKLKQVILELNPDYIISSQYQTLEGIPEEYLKKTIHVHHSAFSFASSSKKTMSTLFKYNGKVIYCWLSKGTMKKANEVGLKNNIYISNPVRFITEKKASVTKNKKLITLTRLSEEKRLDLMINIVEDIFKEQKYSDWKLEIYGEGTEKDNLQNKISNKKQIKLMGRTDDATSSYLASSINLNTSKYEGFSMSILEAQECGVPTISFDFGESAKEQILNKKTGYIIEQDNIKNFKATLIKVMDNSKILHDLSDSCKENSKNFHPNNIVLSWENVFKKIDKEV